jgi:diguanylate cyclase (GGDEF)-like protein
MINKKLIYLPVVAIVALFIAGYFIFKALINSWYFEYVSKDIEASLSGAVIAIERSPTSVLDKSIDRYADSISLLNDEYRYTIISQDGMVLGDSLLSEAEITGLDNYVERPEIATALTHGTGTSIRYSQTLGFDALYMAERFQLGSQVGVMRLSLPLEDIEKAEYGLEMRLVPLMGSSLIFILLLAFYTKRHVQLHFEKDHHQLEQRVKDRTRDIELLQRLANMLAACNSLAEAQPVVEEIVPRILGPLNGAVSLIRSSRNQLEIQLDWGGRWPGDHSYSPNECWALRKGKYHLANDSLTNLPCKHMQEVGDDQTLCLPLIAHGNTVGMMHLYLAGQTLTNERMQLSFTIGEHIGLALSNLSLQEKLREQAIRDPLTGLYNRRYLEESIEHELMRANRREQNFSVLMLDMDHFKRFNDNFGHDAGDYVLKHLGKLLINSIRGEDIACRMGGEELAILLPDTSNTASLHVANKLCDTVREMHLSFNGRTLGTLTLSIGAATFPSDAQDSTSLLKLADTALYQAKENGRDCCCLVTPINEKEKTNIEVIIEKAV